MVIQAVIFGLDGTALDNEPVWEEAFRRVAAERIPELQTGRVKVRAGVEEVVQWCKDRKWQTALKRGRPDCKTAT